jgi:hypothetical protein
MSVAPKVAATTEAAAPITTPNRNPPVIVRKMPLGIESDTAAA